MKEIGGYFELELQQKSEFHKKLWSINLARNAFEFLIQQKKYKKIYIPYFTCDVILSVLEKNNFSFEYYSIDKNFEPLFDYKKIKGGEVLLYTNYFGLKDDFIKKLVCLTNQIIIDNAQSFFSKPIKGIDSFYSARKFFGVSDGAYMTINGLVMNKIEIDQSIDRCSYLLERIEKDASSGFENYTKSEKKLKSESLKEMSLLSKRILSSINYNKVAKKRIQNFDYLHNALHLHNKLKIDRPVNQVPLNYPFWLHKDLKYKLIEKKIYCPTYWPNILESCENMSLEYQMANEITFLPIDQRYSKKDMGHILKIIKELI